MKFLLFSIVCFLNLSTSFAHADEKQDLKEQIVKLAESYQGQPDPDLSKQQALDALVQKLLQIAPQPPIKDRIASLYGVWKQTWGPLIKPPGSRRDNKPELSAGEVYQIIFPGGYYYNVSPVYKDGDLSKERIGMLRGVYEIDGTIPDLLRVKFTKYPGVPARPNDKDIWDLAQLSESKQLKNEVSIVPTFVVKYFFGKGTLSEVYTDEDLRITYGTSDGKVFRDNVIFVLTKVTNLP